MVMPVIRNTVGRPALLGGVQYWLTLFVDVRLACWRQNQGGHRLGLRTIWPLDKKMLPCGGFVFICNLNKLGLIAGARAIAVLRGCAD